MRVINGSAAQGEEFAALQFTNTGSSSCVLYGYPGAQLLLRGRAFGTPAQPSQLTTSSMRLAPGSTGESLLHDYTTCQAGLSDQIRVTVPGSTATAVRPIQLRGCQLRVDPLATPQ